MNVKLISKFETTKNQVKLNKSESNSIGSNANYDNKSQLLSSDGAKALTARSVVSFGKTCSDVEIEDLGGGENISISAISVNSKTTNIVKNSNSKVLAKIVDDKDIVTTKVLNGKFGTSVLVTPKDEKYKGISILLTKGAKMYAKKSSLYVDLSEKTLKRENESVSFAGKFFASIGQNAYPDKMSEAYDSFFNKGIKGAIAEQYDDLDNGDLKEDYNFFVPTDGLGTRLADVTTAAGGTSKPAITLPANIAGQPYKLIHNTLSTFTKTGKLDNDYELIEVDKARGSAFAFLKGLKEGTIPTDKPLVLTWGDAYSDIDLSQVMADYESKGDAGIIDVGIAVDADHIKDFGAMGINKKCEITGFIEKPKTLQEAKFSQISDSNKYLGSVGPYILAPAVLNWLKEKSLADESQFINAKGEYDLSGKILTPMVEILKNNEIKNDDGMPLKMYAHITDCTWSDIGSTPEFITQMLNSHDYAFNLPKEVQKGMNENVDVKNKVVLLSGSKALYEEFCEEYGVSAKGNVIVAKNS